MSDALLSYDHVHISYGGAGVVHDVSFSVCEGEVLAIVGESGSGKSSLLRAAMGRLGTGGLVTRGDIRYKGESLLDLSASRLRKLCGDELALVFQDCLSSFAPLRRIGDQVYESLRAHEGVTREESDSRARTMLGQLGLSDPNRVMASYPFELSGGMGQRVGIAVALLTRPRVLLADEPTSALDTLAQAQVVSLLSRVKRELHTSIVLVTHNLGVAGALADSILVLREGRVVESGPAAAVLGSPQKAYTRELLQATPRLKRKGEST